MDAGFHRGIRVGIVEIRGEAGIAFATSAVFERIEYLDPASGSRIGGKFVDRVNSSPDGTCTRSRFVRKYSSTRLNLRVTPQP